MLMLINNRIGETQFLYTHFNTSHVNVNLRATRFVYSIVDYFNTSHVNVNPCVRIATNADILISIHLMLMLIQ